MAIVGGTGTLGRHLAAELRSRGHEIRVLSRSSPEYRVDLVTGAGLEPALRGCDVVVDASNNTSRNASAVLVGGTRRLLAVEQAAGVAHHVCVSIVGCDQVPMGYYRVKTEQEKLVAQGPVPWTIVRATQFHELVAKAFATAARWRVLPTPRALLQPIASAEVARYIADRAGQPPRRDRPAVAGPEVTELRTLARTWRSVTGRGLALLPVYVPGQVGRALRAGALTTGQAEVHGRISFSAWLEAGAGAAVTARGGPEPR
ncbi:MAG: hypothetical protein QOG05_5165 [Streptosporangiaceae bacterium]|jgi:uncharacterized protein YbjT (DUF2867 family)|nr:hypothetical protein [Streptosporangiaceae bacterium]